MKEPLFRIRRPLFSSEGKQVGTIEETACPLAKAIDEAFRPPVTTADGRHKRLIEDLTDHITDELQDLAGKIGAENVNWEQIGDRCRTVCYRWADERGLT